MIRWGGPPLVCLIIFVETGLFVGFFLPGDSLLVTAGIFAGQNVAPAALAADSGNTLRHCRRPTRLLDWAVGWPGVCIAVKTLCSFAAATCSARTNSMRKYGGRAVILARFVPIVRTFCPPVAGAARMRYSTYLIYDIFGGTLWISSMLLGGYIAGSRIPNISQYLHYIIGVIILLSILPPIIGILRSLARRRPTKRARGFRRSPRGREQVRGSRKFRAIIFDIGRVLVSVDIRKAQLGLTQGLSLTPEELWSAIEKDPALAGLARRPHVRARLAPELVQAAGNFAGV